MWRTTLGAALERYRAEAPRGEFVLVVAGAEPVRAEEATLEDGVALVTRLRGEGVSTRDAVRQAAEDLRLPRKALYDTVVRGERG